MSSIVAIFDPTTDTNATFTAPQAAANGALVFFNESNISLDLTFTNGDTMYLPAWYHRHKCGATGSVQIVWDIHQVLSSTSPPISEVIVESFRQGEAFPADGPLVRQTNTGNVVSTNAVTTLANAISTLGDTVGTSIITAKPNDVAIGNTWSADNAGNLVIQSDNGGALTTLLQLIAGASPAVKLAAIGLFTQLLGGLQTDIIVPFGGDTLQLKSQSGTTQVSIADASPQVSVANDLKVAGSITLTNATNFQGPGTSINGGTSGTATLWQDHTGNIKRVRISKDAFRSGVGVQTIALPFAFTKRALIRTGQIGTSATNAGVGVQAGATPVAINITTVIAAGGATTAAQNFIYAGSQGEISGPFDTIAFQGGETTTHSGDIEITGQ